MRAGNGQVGELLAWADGDRPRMWAVESAAGMGYLLAQQLGAAGETVLDVPATLASRCVLASGQSTKPRSTDSDGVSSSRIREEGLLSWDNGDV